MIYTFKVHPADAEDTLLETTHYAHGVDVMGQAQALIEKHPGCGGVEVLMLGARLFFLPRPSEPATFGAYVSPPPGLEASVGP
jgi:hypothetical protein